MFWAHEVLVYSKWSPIPKIPRKAGFTSIIFSDSEIGTGKSRPETKNEDGG